MNALLDKFDTIQIKNISRIDTEDRELCKLFNQIYSETLECYQKTLNSLILLYNKQILTVKNSYDLSVSMYGDFSISEVMKSIHKIKERFIGKICWHFSKKYNVTIDENKIYNKYKDKELEWHKKENPNKTLKLNLIEYVYLDYGMILDQIFIQLNGFSFWEKAVDEIKQKARMPLHWYDYRKHWNYEVKGKTIKFRTGIKDIKPALYFYDSNETQLIDNYSYNKVDDYKSYENGNTDIKFLKPEYALEFAKKYLGYIEMTEEEREEYKKKCGY
ncbi:MAG: hypothetical protein WCR33_04085 [Bacilli bacterium]